MDTESSLCKDTAILYYYDTEQRVNKVEFLSCGSVRSQEKYEYAKAGYISAIQFNVEWPSKFPGYRKVFYNEHADPIAVDYNEPGSKQTRSKPKRYYEYVYDAHGNWVECKAYLLGDKSKPTLLVERKIEYY